MGIDGRKFTLLACGLLAAVSLYWISFYRLSERSLNDYSFGIELYRGVPRAGIDYSGPLETVPRSFARYELPPLGEKLYLGAAKAALPLSFWALARLFAPPWAAALAACAALLFSMRAGLNHEMLYYCSVFLCAAAAFVLRARDPSPRRSALAGLCLGVSLLLRPPLFLWGLLLWLWEMLQRKYGTLREALAHGLGLVLLPFLFLLPWLWMGANLPDSVPRNLERMRSADNVVAGAYGLAQTTEGEMRVTAGIAPGESIGRWAVGETLSHPLRYLRGMGRRLWLFFAWEPALALCCFGALFVTSRRVPETRLAAGLCAYYLFLHLLMPVEPRYFIPVWLLAFIFPAAIFYRGERFPRDSGAALSAVLAPLLVLSAAVSFLALAYPSRASAFTGFSYDAPPKNAWLLSRACGDYLATGDAGKAALFCRLAAADERPDPDARPTLFIYLLSRGENLDAALLASPFADYLPQTHAYRALYVASPLLNGGRLEAERRYAKMLNYWKGGVVYFRGRVPDYENPLLKKHYDSSRAFEEYALFPALGRFPPDLRTRLARELVGIGADIPAIEYLALSGQTGGAK